MTPGEHRRADGLARFEDEWRFTALHKMRCGGETNRASADDNNRETGKIHWFTPYVGGYEQHTIFICWSLARETEMVEKGRKVIQRSVACDLCRAQIRIGRKKLGDYNIAPLLR
jgi:hypothetical protein